MCHRQSTNPCFQKEAGVCCLSEGGHDHLLRYLAPGKVARRGGGKHLGRSLLIPVGNISGVIEEIAAPVFGIAFPGFLRPFVIPAGVIHHEIRAHGDAADKCAFHAQLGRGHRHLGGSAAGIGGKMGNAVGIDPGLRHVDQNFSDGSDFHGLHLPLPR